LTQPVGEHWIKLDCNHSRTGAVKRAGQRAGSCTEIEHEVAAPDARSANELRCELATAEEVLAAAAM
jgi:hypothetical protein